MGKQAFVLAVVLTLTARTLYSQTTTRPVGGTRAEVVLGPTTKAAGESEVMDVVATGVGTDPDGAKQNAFANAIEQVVGVLVDAETIVKNDRLIRDQVLTFSRGKLLEFTVIGTWKEGDLHYVRIRGKVPVARLTDDLKAKRIAVRDVPGELIYRQIKFDANNAESAAEMLRKTLDGYAMHKLASVEIVGKPETVATTDTKATLRVQLRLAYDDPGAWRRVRTDLERVLGQVGKRASITFNIEAERGGSLGAFGRSMILTMQQWSARTARRQKR